MQLFQVDSFTTKPFKGNPAGVCLLDKFPVDSVMQNIAMELNLSETAFVEIKDNQYTIKFFTPTMEVPLCGHATLASAHILYEQQLIPKNKDFIFKAKDSDLSISKKGDQLKMVFPTFTISEASFPTQFNSVFDISPIELFKSENNWVIARLATEEEVLNAHPNFELFRQHNYCELVIVTAESSSPDFDFVLRVFCNPESGILEDPVTGSINCILVPYWSMVTGKTSFRSKQISARTGKLQLELTDNKVIIYGQAVTVFSLEIYKKAIQF